MRRAALLALLLAASPAAAQAPDLAAGITEEEVSVGANYGGARLTVFGAHWRRGRAPSDVVVVLRGPAEVQVIRRKRQVAGLWINADPVKFTNVPSFFALASTRPVNNFLSARTIDELGLDAGAIPQLEGGTPADTDSASYRRAIVRLKRAEGLYPYDAKALKLDEDGLFQVAFAIPPNAPIGRYAVDVYLFRDARLVKRKENEIRINRIGIEKTVHTAAQKRPLLYGFVSVLLALAAGYAAAFVFRRS